MADEPNGRRADPSRRAARGPHGCDGVSSRRRHVTDELLDVPVVRDVEIPVSGVQSNRRREDPWTRCCRSAARVSSITIVEPVLKVDREGWPM